MTSNPPHQVITSSARMQGSGAQVSRHGDVGSDGCDAERQAEHQMGQAGEPFAIAVKQQDGERSRCERRRQGVDGRGNREKQRGIDSDEPQRASRER